MYSGLSVFMRSFRQGPVRISIRQTKLKLLPMQIRTLYFDVNMLVSRVEIRYYGITTRKGGNNMSLGMILCLSWLALFLILLVIELVTFNLTTIWFAAGALVALILTIVGCNVVVQGVAFIVVSIAALLFTRPLVEKYVKGRTSATNCDALIGQQCKVTEAIDGMSGTGAVYLDGKTWTARLESDAERAEVGDIVEVESISGVKLFVRKIS